MGTDPPIEVAHRNAVTWITLSAPETGNALGEAMVEALTGAVLEAARRGDRAIVLGARGPRFCVGLDLALPVGARALPPLHGVRRFLQCMRALACSPLPTIAAVEGDVLAGGVGIAAACDLVVAAPEVGFQLSEAIVGMIPAAIAPFVVRRTGVHRLQALTLSSRRLVAADALAVGLVDELAEDVAAAVDRQLARVLRSSPAALARTKTYLAGFQGTDLDRQIEEAMTAFESWVAQPEVMQGVQAFAEGFAPPWFQKYRGRDG